MGSDRLTLARRRRLPRTTAGAAVSATFATGMAEAGVTVENAVAEANERRRALDQGELGSGVDGGGVVAASRRRAAPNPMLPAPWGRDVRGSARRLAATLRRLGALGPPAGIGMMLAVPTLLAHGSPSSSTARANVLNGQHGWCQLFSEPGAGSDLAGLQTRAERDGDEWVVNGQKVWTSSGQSADYGILVARSDPTLPKHRGITYFAFPMRQQGVDVRPLREMTGRAMFNEVFLTDAACRTTTSSATSTAGGRSPTRR